MTIDEFRQALGCLIVDSQPLPIRDVLNAIEDECEALRGEQMRMAHRAEKRDSE